jgi:hypothetical protein
LLWLLCTHDNFPGLSAFTIFQASFLLYSKYRLKTINIFVKMVMSGKLWVVPGSLAQEEK